MVKARTRSMTGTGTLEVWKRDEFADWGGIIGLHAGPRSGWMK